MPRNLETQTVKRFKGIDVWSSFVNSSPEYATDSLNVIPSSSGGLEKMRLPVALTAMAIAGFPVHFRQYQNANSGVKQVIAQFGSDIYSFDTAWTPTKINSDARNAQELLDFVESNNLFFGSNRYRNFKWDGATFTSWGIAAPVSAPVIATSQAPGAVAKTIAAAAATKTIAGGSGRGGPGFENIVTLFTTTAHGLSVGDLIQVAGCTPESFNGFFVVESTPLTTSLTYHQVAADENITGFGTVQSAFASGAYRSNNLATITTTTAHGRQVGDRVTIAGVTDTSFNGVFTITDVFSVTQFGYDQFGANAISGAGTETPSNSALFTLGGRRYRISYKNSTTTHVGNASAESPATGNLNGTLNVTVRGPACPDANCDRAILWSTFDGGADYYFNQEIAIAPLTAPLFQDTVLDSDLNTALIAPLINNVPPLGKVLRKWQGRILIIRTVDDAQGIAYSGYERILVGRPEESFPPNNRLRLAIGADELTGGGAVATGFVIFGRSHRDKQDSMYILRGQLQDITVDAPVQLSSFLQPLPWKLGSFSANSEVETPHGLVWLASDKTIQLYDGESPPKMLSRNINPGLRLITPGTESTIRATFFNFLEREWYVLACAVLGSVRNNRIVIVDLDPNPESNVGIFTSDIAADDVSTIEDLNGQSQLVILASGVLKQFLANSDTYWGITPAVTSTTGNLIAYWRSGVFGNESPQTIKMFRWAHVVRDPNPSEFYVQARVIKEDDNFEFPTLLGKVRLEDDGRFPVNDKGRRIVYDITFPATDESANLVELSSTYIPLAER